MKKGDAQMFNNLPDGITYLVSGMAGAAVTLLLGWLGIRKDTQLGMSKEQREWMKEMRAYMADQSERVLQLNQTVDEQYKRIGKEREAHERQLVELQRIYNKRLEDQEHQCRQEMDLLQVQINKLAKQTQQNANRIEDK